VQDRKNKRKQKIEKVRAKTADGSLKNGRTIGFARFQGLLHGSGIPGEIFHINPEDLKYGGKPSHTDGRTPGNMRKRLHIIL